MCLHSRAGGGSCSLKEMVARRRVEDAHEEVQAAADRLEDAKRKLAQDPGLPVPACCQCRLASMGCLCICTLMLTNSAGGKHSSLHLQGGFGCQQLVEALTANPTVKLCCRCMPRHHVGQTSDALKHTCRLTRSEATDGDSPDATASGSRPASSKRSAPDIKPDIKPQLGAMHGAPGQAGRGQAAPARGRGRGGRGGRGRGAAGRDQQARVCSLLWPLFASLALPSALQATAC